MESIKEAYKTLKDNDLYFKDSPAIKAFHKVCYDFIYNDKPSKGEISYPEAGGKIVYNLSTYKPPVIKLVKNITH